MAPPTTDMRNDVLLQEGAPVDDDDDLDDEEEDKGKKGVSN